MKRLLILLGILFALPAFGQGVRFGDQQPVTSVQTSGGPLYSVPNATINWCNFPANGVPCTNKATTYTSIALTTPCSTSTQVTLSASSSCVATTDPYGNWGVWVAAGTYTFTITIPNGNSIGPFTVTLSSGGGTNILPLSNTFTGATNNFVNILQVGGNNVAGTSGVFTIGDCISVLSTAPLVFQDAGTCGGGGGSGTVVSSPRYQIFYQPNAGSSATAQGASGITTDSTFSNLFTKGNNYTGGPNPWADSATFGMRAVPSVFQTTATCSTGSPNTITLAAASSFQTGDGIVLYQCGATNTVGTPGTPTVTPKLRTGPDIIDVANPAIAGATSYSYTIVARDLNGGLTAQSSAGTTTTGAAALGTQSVAVTSLSRSNNVVTVNMSAGIACSVGAVVFITGSTDASFSGYPVIASCPSGTQFTYLQNVDTRAGCILTASTGTCSTNAATGGTAQVYPGNYITWTASTGPVTQYYIYKSGTLVGATRSNETYWLDLGQAAPSLPDFVPTSAPSSATNDYLATTITAGGGTTTLTIAGTVLNNSSGLTAKFDDAPNFALLLNSCATTAATRTSCHISAAPTGTNYYFNSALALITASPVHILQENPIFLNETISDPGSTIFWSGVMGGAGLGSSIPAFGWSQNQTIFIGTAYPGLLINSSSATFDHLNFSVSSPNGLGMVTNVPGFNLIISQSNFGIGGTDIVGQALVEMGTANSHLTDVSFSANTSSSYGYSITPLVLLRPDIAYANPSGDFTCDHCFFVGRGFGFDAISLGGFGRIEFNSTYSQAIRTPLIEAGNYNSPSISVHGYTADTTSSPTVANWNPNVNDTAQIDLLNVENAQNEANGPPGNITGNPVYGTNQMNGGALTGQNTNTESTNNDILMNLPTLGVTYSAFKQQNLPVSIDPTHTLFMPLPTPTGLVATPAAGGTMAAATNVYTVTAIGWDGGETGPSAPATCVTSGGNGTCNLSWTAVTGAKGYNYYWQGITHQAGTISTNSASMTANACCNNPPPAATGTGSTTIMSTQVIAPQFTLTTPLSGGVSASVSATATPAGGWIFPNVTVSSLAAGGNPVVCVDSSGLLQTAGCSAGAGTVTHTTGALAAGQYVAGNGAADTGTYPSVNFPVVMLNALTSHNAVSVTAGASIASSGSTVTCASCGFTSGVVGRAITLGINGVGPGSGGTIMVTTIATYVSSTQVTVAATAGTSNLTGLSLVYGTDDATAINSAISTMSGNGGGELQIPCGYYYIGSTIQTYPNVNVKVLGMAGEGSAGQDCVDFFPAGNVTTAVQIGVGSSQQFQAPTIANLVIEDLFSHVTNCFLVNGSSNGTFEGTVARACNATGAAGYRYTFGGGSTQASTWAMNDSRAYDCTIGVDAGLTSTADGPKINGGEYFCKNTNTNFAGAPIGIRGATLGITPHTHVIVGQNAGGGSGIGVQIVTGGSAANVQPKIEGTSLTGIGVDFLGSESRGGGFYSCQGLAVCTQFESGASFNIVYPIDVGSNTQLVNDLSGNNSNVVHTQNFDLMPRWAFASLPSTTGLPNNAAVLVVDCATSSCVAGGGSIREIFVNESGTWTSISGAGGGGSPGGSTDAVQYNAGGGVWGGVNSPTANGTYGLVFNVTGSAAVVPTAALPGVTVSASSSASPSVAQANLAGMFQTTNSTTSTAVTVPSGSGLSAGFVFAHCNTGSVVATDTPSTSTVNGNTTIKLQGNVVNPSCALWWTDPSFNYWSAVILPTDANGRLSAAGVPAFTGDATNSAGSLAVTVSGINGTAFAGTPGHLVSFGAANIPADSNVVAANVTTQTSNGASNQVCTYTGANKVCVPGVVTNAMLQNASTTVNSQTCTLGSTCTITAAFVFPATVSGTTTSGGIPYFSNTTTLTSSGLLCTNCLVAGAGAGGAPTTGNGDFTYATHTLTGGASGLVDFSAITSSSGFKVPIHSANTAGAAGVVDYDSTAGSTHMFTGGADSISAGFASAPTTGQVVVTSGTAGVIAGSTTPNLGTPSAVTLTNATGLPCGAMPALTGDTTTSATSCATTTAKINGTAFPTSATVVGSNGSAQPIAATTTGSGTTVVLATSPTLVTPVIGAATGTSLIASGVVDGKAIVNVTTGATLTFGTTGTACSSCYYDNEEATAGTAITGTLPTASAGLQYCIDNAYNGSAANTGTLEILTSAAGQYIIYTDGTLSASGGYVISGGAARDSACVRGVDSTHWMLYVYSGTWTKH